MRFASKYKNSGLGKVRPAEEVDRWCERFERECRTRGIRRTIQRLAVYRAIARDTSHPPAEAVYIGVRADIPSLSFATVYRILECLAREKFIRRASARGGVVRYDANVEPHHHLICRRCERMIDYSYERIAALPLPRNVPLGFKAEEMEIRIMGICAECRRNVKNEDSNRRPAGAVRSGSVGKPKQPR